MALFLELLGRMPKRVYEKVWRALLRLIAMIGAGFSCLGACPSAYGKVWGSS